MKKKIAGVLLPFIAILFEILPYGAVLIFAPSPTERIRKTFSYFSLDPVGYANFGPFLTACLTCVILVLVILCFVKYNIRIVNALYMTSITALITSLLPLMFGFEYFSIVGAVISIILIIEILIAKSLSKNRYPT